MPDINPATNKALQNGIYSELRNTREMTPPSERAARRTAVDMVTKIRGMVAKEIDAQRELGYGPYEEMLDTKAEIETREGEGGVPVNYVVIPEEDVRNARNAARQ